MLIVQCQNCNEMKVLAGAPDADGVARVSWVCPLCGAGQVSQLAVSGDARGQDLRKILGGMQIGSSYDQEAVSYGEARFSHEADSDDEEDF